MTPEQLRTSVLQYALSGKLVPQIVEEGSAEDLIKENKRIREQYIEANKIKKSKPLEEISDSEIPYEIPENWKWVRIGDFCIDVFSGKSPKYSKTPTEYRIIGQAANQQKGLCYEQTKYTDADFWSDMPERYFVKEYDVLLNTLGNGTLGRSGIVKVLPHKLLTDGHLFVFRFTEHTEAMFFYYYLQYKRTEIERSANGSTNQTFLSLRNTSAWIIPIPPLEEQHRIVAKIEELLPYVDRYAEAYEKLEQFNAKFPDDMKKSILQYAIQGKLVEQRPEEETAEELYQQIQDEKQKLIKEGKIKKVKPLAEITEDEIPFDIPESWKWCRLQDICTLIADVDHKMPKSVPASEGKLFLSAKDLLDDGTINYTENVKYISKEDFERLSKKAKPTVNDIIYSRIGAALGKARVVENDIEFIVSYSCCVIRTLINEKYLRYYLESPLILKHSVLARQSIGVPDLGMGEIKQYIVALPPIEEQKRIVDRLEKILPYCNKLSK